MARFSHGITVLPATHARTITVYWPATEHHCHLAGTQCAYPQRDGQAELTWVAGYRLGVQEQTFLQQKN